MPHPSAPASSFPAAAPDRPAAGSETAALRTATASSFGGFQDRFYADGVLNATSDLPFTYDGWKARGEEAMNPLIAGYVSGGAGDEHTQQANTTALRRFGLVPRMMRDRRSRDLSTEFLGRLLPAPVFACPVGVLGAVYPDGDLAVARAMAALGLAGMYSTLSEAPLEQVADAARGSWAAFQLYPTTDAELTHSLVRRAEAAGFDALTITVDTGTLGWRPRDLAHGFIPMLRGRCLANYLTDPRFLRLAGVRQATDLTPYDAGRAWGQVFSNPNFTWDDVRAIRRLTDLPIIIKGICSAGDAADARREGMDAIACSNHGGRQANGGIAAIHHLAQVLEAAGSLPVTFDSGLRDGVDILRTVGLGAALAGVGRPMVYALATAGQRGVEHLFSSLLAEADLTMAVDSYASLADLRIETAS